MIEAANADAEKVTVEKLGEKKNEAIGSGIRCVMCSAELDAKTARRKGGVTCPPNERDCAARYRKMRRDLIEQGRSRCRSCGAPSNPKERELFRQWRKETKTPATRGRKKRCTGAPNV